MSDSPRALVRFEGYVIDRARWQLRYGEEVLALNRKTFDLLLHLVDHADRVVSKEELLHALWPESFIEEGNLTQQIFLLRKALNKHASGTRIIETVSGRGYRFAVPVDADASFDLQTGFLPVPPAVSAPPQVERTANHPRRYAPPLQRLWALGAAAAALLVALALVWRMQTRQHLAVSGYTQITHDGHAKSLGGTDGNRIYFTRLEKSSLAQMPITGGREALLPVSLQDPWSGAVSPDGSTLLIISQAAGQGPAASLWALELVSGSLHQLGNAISSAWSPNGQEIVYASATGELGIMHRDGSDARRIATAGSNVSSISWSPDGRVIRFSRDGLLWEIGTDGSNLHQLLPAWGKGPTQRSGEWSSDGTYFFVADGQIWLLENEGGRPWRTSPRPIQLTYGPTVWDRPICTPDGKKILASGRTNRGELVRFDLTSAQAKPFLAGTSAEFVSFSEAAKAVAYVSFPEGVLWRAKMDGSNPVPLTEPPLHPKSVRWSPDGSQIAFVDRTESSVASIFIMAGSGTGKPRRLIPGDTEAENDPSWSPDGRKLAFSTSPNFGASAKSDLRIADIASGSTTPIPGSDGLAVPHWAPDGKTIAAMTLDAKSMRVLDLATGRWSPLDTGAVAFPEWSNDGRWIYYVRWTANPAIVRIRVADGKREDIVDLTGTRYTGYYTLWMGLDPNDAPLMLRDVGSDDIYALTLQRN